MCRICKQRFDREKTKENEYWVKPSKNMYYHKECYDNWKAANTGIDAQMEDQKWLSYIWDFLSHDLKVPYDYQKCARQMINFNKKGKTYKGMFFTLKYFYEVRHGNWDKSEGGVGIIPYVYEESTEYWSNQYLRNKKIIEGIEAQMESRAKRQEIVVRKKNETAPKIKTYNLDTIIGEEDDD